MARRVVLIFVDGLGVGPCDPAVNPLARRREGLLAVFASEGPGAGPVEGSGGGVALGLDAGLGVPGLPQSATGQTALLTGVNAPRLLGRHLFGFPNARLREVILDRSLLKLVCERGRTAAFLNTYRPAFFDAGETVWETRLSVTTWCNRAAELPFFGFDDLRRRRSIYNEFTNRVLVEAGWDVPLFSPEEAGRILGARSRDLDFLLFEYFRTDFAGHACDMDRALAEVDRLGRFVGAALEELDLEETLVILTSDHGNLEDLSVRSHTGNPALTRLWGAGAAEAATGLRSIQDVPEAVLRALDEP